MQLGANRLKRRGMVLFSAFLSGQIIRNFKKAYKTLTVSTIFFRNSNFDNVEYVNQGPMSLRSAYISIGQASSVRMGLRSSSEFSQDFIASISINNFCKRSKPISALSQLSLCRPSHLQKWSKYYERCEMC